MKTSFLAISLFFLLTCFFSSCEKEKFNIAPFGLSQEEASLEMREDDPCDGPVIIAPETYVRSGNRKVAIHRIVNMEVASDVCLKINTRDVVAAWIVIDGDTIFTPKNFKKPETNLQVVTFFESGVHDISFTLGGKPGGTITIELNGGIVGPPPAKLCSEAAREACESRGWQVVQTNIPEGNLVCTIDGRGPEANCDSCGVYNIFVWKNGSREQTCLDDGYTGPYSTLAGVMFAGHVPCECGDNLFFCGQWDMQDCIPD